MENILLEVIIKEDFFIKIYEFQSILFITRSRLRFHIEVFNL